MAKALPTNTRVGPYTIEKALPQGRGGMARIYVALFKREGWEPQRVALKMAYSDDDVDKQRFFFDALNNEVEMLKKLKHPHIVRLYPIPWGTPTDPYIARAAGLEGRPWFCTMEYLEGGTLQAYSQKRKKLAVEEAVEIASQVTMALEYIHDKQISHLDVKPDNVLFRYPPYEDHTPLEAVLVDFGIARRHSKPTGIEAGAYSFMPPERVRMALGEIPPEQITDQRPADIYGVGILLYQMLTGRLPFSGRSRSSITSSILRKTPTQIRHYRRDLPVELDRVVQRTLEKDPQRRPTAHELSLMLDKALPPPRLSRSPSFVPRGKTPVPPAPPRTWPFRLAVGGTLLFGLMSLAEFAVIAKVLKSTPTPTPMVVSQQHTPSPIPATENVRAPLPSVTPSPRSSERTVPPTVTLVPTTSRPSPAPTRTPTATRQTQDQPVTNLPAPSYSAPALLSPPDNAALGSQMNLRWQWDGTLAADEYFDVRVWKVGRDHTGITWTSEKSYTLLKRDINDPGLYYWSVAVIQGRNGKVIKELSPEATPRSFTR